MRNPLQLVLLLSVLFAGTAGAQTFAPSDAVEAVGSGKVNWTTGEVYATGLGAPPATSVNQAQARAMAERAAFVDALRNLLETVKGVRVDSETVIENFMTKSDVIRTKVEGVVKGARILKTRYLSDGSVEVLVVMLMKGAFLNAVVPETFGKYAPIPAMPSAPKPAQEKRPEPAKPAPVTPPPPPVSEKKQPVQPELPKPALPAPAATQKQPEPVAPEPAKPSPSEPEKKAEPVPSPPKEPTMAFKGGLATGVVIDGRGLGLRPALLPKIVDPQGNEIYVGQIVTRTNAVEQGVAGYAKDVNAAVNNFRVTDNPAVIKGVQASGVARTDVMIAQSDARSLSNLGRKGEFLQNCRVIIVY